jgi:hypothetical protein
VTTGICPGHRVQSMTCSTLTPNHCPTCKVWYGTNSGEWFEISLPSEDDDGSAAEIATLKAELTAARETVERMAPVVAAAEAQNKAYEAKEEVRPSYGGARGISGDEDAYAKAREAYEIACADTCDALDTFRSTSKTQEPTSE